MYTEYETNCFYKCNTIFINVESVLVLAYTKFLDRSSKTLAFVSKTKMNETVCIIAKKCEWLLGSKTLQI